MSIYLSLCLPICLYVYIVYICLARFLEQRRYELHSLGPEPDEDIGVGLQDGFDRVTMSACLSISLFVCLSICLSLVSYQVSGAATIQTSFLWART
jgi:hypothetical protein